MSAVDPEAVRHSFRIAAAENHLERTCQWPLSGPKPSSPVRVLYRRIDGGMITLGSRRLTFHR